MRGSPSSKRFNGRGKFPAYSLLPAFLFCPSWWTLATILVPSFAQYPLLPQYTPISLILPFFAVISIPPFTIPLPSIYFSHLPPNTRADRSLHCCAQPLLLYFPSSIHFLYGLLSRFQFISNSYTTFPSSRSSSASRPLPTDPASRARRATNRRHGLGKELGGSRLESPAKWPSA